MRNVLMACLWLAPAVGAQAAGGYVDVESRGGPCHDAGPGTLRRPWRTLARATAGPGARPGPGDTVWVRGGVYREPLTLERGGTAARPLAIRAYPGEKPVIDGEGQRARGIYLPEKGAADHVVIEGLTVRNLPPGGTGVAAERRKCVTLRHLEVSGGRIGVWLAGCTDCSLLSSQIHHSGETVLVDTGCSGIVVADNHLHHALEGMGLSIYAPGTAVRGEDAVASIEPAGPGLARFTTAKLDLRKVRDGTLRGQDSAGTVKDASLVLFFPEREPAPDGKPLAGGSVRLQDGRQWFVLRANREWGDKPYAPDGRAGLFELAGTTVDGLSRARSVYVTYVFGNEVASRDIEVLRNEVDHAAVQGIWVQRAEGVLLRGNRTHHNGATGIQIESLSRRIWLEGNVSYANSTTYAHETGIWLDETIEAVVQDNVVYENQKGMGVTQCEWVVVRRNVIADNQAQHATQDLEARRQNSGAFWFSGGRHNHLGAPPGAQHNAFVHNTLVRNGADIAECGGIRHGFPTYPTIGRNLILNNLLLDNPGTYAVSVWNSPAVLDGNIYHASGPVKARWYGPQGEATYAFSGPQELAAYTRATGQDEHSLVAEVAFADAGRRDFRLAKGSAAVDRGQPLTRATAAGSGTALPVADVSPFSAGFRTSRGKVLILGDEIRVGRAKARVVAIDREKSRLLLDRRIRWRKGDPVAYAYKGSGPDAGAFESP